MSMAEGSDPMTADVIQLPRPRQARTGPAPLAFFVRVGFNDHREMLELITVGERGFFGFVIEAQYVERHRELIEEARRRDFGLILDPKTQPMALQGGHNERLGALPWVWSATTNRRTSQAWRGAGVPIRLSSSREQTASPRSWGRRICWAARTTAGYAATSR
jgi:hypothetical protein